MAPIAVDIALLPSEEMMDRAIEANKHLLKQCPDKIALDKENCLPHVSLAMGCIDEEDIGKIGDILQNVAESCSPGQLSVAGIQTGTNAGGEKVSVLQLKKTKPLQLLHETVMRRLAPYFSHDVTADMVLSPPAADKATLLWIKDYPEKSSFEWFSPHITLGYGQIDNISFPATFAAPRLALCHLGNHCTCKRVLFSVGLRS
jgi:2'-5' RNA ligase